jgi:dTDP-4-dehydrorhamnose reductase
MTIKILVLGHTGLLGNTVDKFLSNQTGLKIVTLDKTLRWPSPEFMDAAVDINANYIINCVGAIHQRTTEFTVNYELPIWLDTLGVRIIHPGTDCEIDDDAYGISKKTARDFIVQHGKNTKIIKTSIIGPEVNSSYSLFDWFLSQPDDSSVNGFINQYWNGNTTLEWAKVCLNLINSWDEFQTETIITTNCVSKYELLSKINNTFERRIHIIQTEGTVKYKCLSGVRRNSIDEQLIELKKFMRNSI